MMKANQVLVGFKERLLEILDEKSQVWWAENLGVSQSVLSGGWKKGSFPKSDNLAKIITLSGVSPNWLLLGLGPKYIRDYDARQIDLHQDRSREIQVRIMEKEAEIQSLKKRLAALERMVAQHRIGVPVSGMGDLPDDEDSERQHVLDTSVLPMITLVRSLNDLLCKALENYVQAGDADEKIKRMVSWIYDNFDKNQQDALVAIKALEKTLGD